MIPYLFSTTGANTPRHVGVHRFGGERWRGGREAEPVRLIVVCLITVTTINVINFVLIGGVSVGVSLFLVNVILVCVTLLVNGSVSFASFISDNIA